jgi:pseudaminic acid cytidylyltransferase
MKKRVAIIPARGGSKRVPRKNIKSFLGKPIIQYSIEAAMSAGVFDEVMVSTDDEEIAAISRACGAKVPFMRSAKTADDFATTAEVLLEVITAYENLGLTFDTLCCIYPTAPFVTAEKLQEAVRTLEEQSFDTVLSVLPFDFPIQRAVRLDAAQQVSFFQEQYVNTRSQDLERAYHDAGQFYCLSVPEFKIQQKIWTTKTGGIVLNPTHAQDIDTLEDWEIAELKYKILYADKT